MNCKAKQVAVFRLSASFTSSAWRSEKSWSDLTAELRAQRINRPELMSEEDESCVAMDEALSDYIQISSSVGENASRFQRPSSVTWQKELANTVHLIGRIEQPVSFKYTKSDKALAWTSLRTDYSHDSHRVGLYFMGELANIANQHLRKCDRIHVSGELKQIKHIIWVMAKELQFIQSHPTSDAGAITNGLNVNDPS